MPDVTVTTYEGTEVEVDNLGYTITVSQGAPAQDGVDGEGVPAGGTEGQVLAKASGTDYDTEWVDQTGGPGGGSTVTVDADGTVTVDGTPVELATDAQLAAAEAAAAADATTKANAAQAAAEATAAAALAAEATLARNADNLTSGTVADARIASTIARDTEVTAAISASEAGQVRDGDTAGGVLAGTYPNPSFAADMATQAELDAHLNDTTDAHDASAISVVPFGSIAATNVQAALEEVVSEASGGGATDLEGLADVDLTSPQNDDILQQKAGVFVNRTPAQFKTDLALTKSDVGLGSVDNLSLQAHLDDTSDAHDASAISFSAIGNIAATDVQAAIAELDTEKQAGDADLTAIAGLSPSNDDVIQRKAGAWTNRTMAQVKTDLALVKGDVGLGNVDNVQQQPLDSDLTTIAGLTATTDNFMQAKSSAWASRTPTQVRADLDAIPAQINAQTGTSYTLVLADAGKFVTMSNASASTLTVPPNSSVAFPVGTVIEGAQLGAGQVTLTPGSGVTINGTPGLKIAAQYGSYALVKTATDTWLAVGRLAA
ncbi:MAG TPA: hypothetical protein VJL80_00185 [Aeromicrobium sp.]|nr:hypothetical protein [Aeromicrobium sp.]